MSPTPRRSLQKYLKKNQNTIKKHSKGQHSYSDYISFIRKKCAAANFSKSIPIPSSNNVLRCSICHKTEKELENMMIEKFGEDWKLIIKQKYCNGIRPGLKNLHVNTNSINVPDYFDNKLTISEEIHDSIEKGNNNIGIFNTLPDQVEFKLTEDKNFAVIAKEKIKPWTKFGPYCGMTDGKKPINSDSYWQFEAADGSQVIFNGDSCVRSNWMSRVRKNKNTANCVAWVANDKVFYKSIATINPGEELFVHPDLFVGHNVEHTLYSDDSISQHTLLSDELSQHILYSDELNQSLDEDIPYRLYDELPKGALNHLTGFLNIIENHIPHPLNWIENFDEFVENRVKNAFNFKNEDDTAALNEATGEKLLNRDLISLNDAKLTDKLVKYYVNLQYQKKVRICDDICYILPVTNIHDVFEAVIAKEVVYVVGCYRVNSDNWISVLAMRNSDKFYICSKYAKYLDLELKQTCSLLEKFFKSVGWGKREVKEMEVEDISRNFISYDYNEEYKTLNSAVVAIEFVDQILDHITSLLDKMAEDKMNQIGVFKLKIDVSYLAFGVQRWMFAKDILGKEKEHQEPTDGKYTNTDKTLNLVKVDQISEEQKDVFTDVQKTILSYHKLTEIINGKNLQARELRNWVQTYEGSLSDDVRRIFTRKWSNQLRFTAKLMASGQSVVPSDLLTLGETGWLTLEMLRYYTHRQIERFGLEDQVCYFAMDNTELVKNYKTVEMFKGDLVASPDKRISKAQYCVCAFNEMTSEYVGAHFVSLFASKHHGTIYITDPGVIDRKDEDAKIISILQDVWHVEMKVVRTTKKNYQQDGYNCGVYCAEYNEQILNAVKISNKNPKMFHMPDELRVDVNLMSSGVYRWRMAEFVLHGGVGLPMDEYCYLMNQTRITFTRKDLEEFQHKNGDEIVVCGTCGRAYRSSEKKEFIIFWSLNKKLENFEYECLQNYITGDYCVFCRSSENLETKRFVKKINQDSSISQVKEIPELPERIEPESPKLLSRQNRGSKKVSTKVTDGKITSQNKTPDDSESKFTNSSGQKRNGSTSNGSNKKQKAGTDPLKPLKKTPKRSRRNNEASETSSACHKKKSNRSKSVPPCKKKLFEDNVNNSS